MNRAVSGVLLWIRNQYHGRSTSCSDNGMVHSSAIRHKSHVFCFRNTQGYLARNTALWTRRTHTYNTHGRCQMRLVGPWHSQYGNHSALNIGVHSHSRVCYSACHPFQGCRADLKIVSMIMVCYCRVANPLNSLLDTPNESFWPWTFCTKILLNETVKHNASQRPFFNDRLCNSHYWRVITSHRILRDLIIYSCHTLKKVYHHLSIISF